MIRDKNNIETPVHHQATNNNIYFNWISHAPNKSKMGTLWTFVRKGYDICSTNEPLQNELCYIKKVFREQNQYSFWTINKVFCEIKQLNKATTSNCKSNTNNNYQVTHHMKKYQIEKNTSYFYRIKGKRLPSFLTI